MMVFASTKTLSPCFIRINEVFYFLDGGSRVRILVDINPLFCYKKADDRIAGTGKRQKNGRRNRFPGN
jgi:hypothetical protein